MNTNRRINLWVACLAAAALASCSKEGDMSPAAEAAESPVVVFQGTLEAPEGSTPVTKMDISDGQGQQKLPVWEEGDKIKVFYKDPGTDEMASVEAVANASGTETTFTASLPEGVSTYYAVYPANLPSEVDEEGNFSVTMRKGGDDAASFSQACISIAKSGPEKKFHFRNLCSILKFTLESKGSILQISSLDGAPLDGTIKASIGENGSVVYDADEPFSDTHYSRQFAKAGADNTTCYVAILPKPITGGIAINHLATYTAPAAFANVSIPFGRSRIYDLGVVDSHVVKDYYFTESGAGDKSGLSWENAGDVQTFKSLVGCTDPEGELKLSRYLHIWKTKGITCHFAEGTYVFGDETSSRLTVDFKGADGTVFSEFSIVGVPGQTVFSGDGKYGIMNVFDRARIHIEGVTFADAVSSDSDITAESTDRGAALYIKDSYSNSQGNQASEKKAAPRVWLTGCVFEGNRTNHNVATGKFVGGSAINIANGAVYADHCVFRGNFDQGAAGCVRMSGNYDREWLVSYAFFNACLFTENTVGSYNTAWGCGIHQDRKGGLLGLYNCTLYNNNASAPDGDRKGWNILNFNRSAIVANTTVVDNIYADGNATPGYAVRVDVNSSGMNHYVFANNLLMNTQAAASQNRGYTLINADKNTTGKIYMEGGSLFGFWGSSYTHDCVSVTQENEYGTGTSSKAYGYTDVDSAEWKDGLFRWAGTLKNGNVTCNFMSSAVMTENVLKSGNINQSDDKSHVTFSTTQNGGDNEYAGFYAWLNSLNAIDVDAEGNPRPATGWTPGAYQVQ